MLRLWFNSDCFI